MQIGSLHVFPKANRKDQHCCMCNVVLKPKTAYVHNFKCEKVNGFFPEQPKRPQGYYPVFTCQLWFCSPECVTLRALQGVYLND